MNANIETRHPPVTSLLGRTLLIGMLVAAHPAPAVNPPAPFQELFNTESVYPQEEGEVQLTSMPRWRHGDSVRRFELPFNIEYGLTDNFQIEAGWTALSLRNPRTGAASSGVGDLELGVKYSFMDIRGSGAHLALAFETELPIGDIDRELTEGFVEYEPSVILARDFPQWGGLQLFAQAGLGLVQRVKSPVDPDDREPPAHELNLAAGFHFPLGPTHLTTELNWSNNRWNHGGTENQLFVTPGLVWPWRRGWEVGLAAPIGLTEQADDIQLVFQLVWEFGDD